MNCNIIYILKNKCNNKVYIGQTWNTLKERGDGGYGYIKSSHLYNAIKKYGWDNFYYEFLTLTHTQEVADYWEQYFIDKFKSNNRKYGYNIKLGGSHGKHSVNSTKGRKLSEEHKKKISHSLIGNVVSEETKNKISKTQKGRPRPYLHR